MRDWQDGKLRYLVHFSDGGSGMRYRETQLATGDELTEGAERYVVERVVQPRHGQALGHAWVTRSSSASSFPG
jgi:hypothetical protein